MKINMCFGLLLMCFVSGLWAVKPVYIINNSTETISVKGPVKATNKAIVPATLKPGEILIKDADLEGNSTDTLVVTILGNTTQVIRSYSKKYTKPAVLIYVVEDKPEKFGAGFDLWQGDYSSQAPVTTPTSF